MSSGFGSSAITGTGNDDVIYGTPENDFIDGGDGRDQLYGGAGFDHIVGGLNNDRIFGEDGEDLIGGQDGDDFIDGGADRDRLYGDAGDDHIVGGLHGDFIHGQDGKDLIGGQDGDDFIDGGSGEDRLYGDAGDDHIIGGTEDDLILGQEGNDLIGGQDGNDRIEGGAGVDRLYGDAGNDHMTGGTEDDFIAGQEGDDLIGGEDGNDRIEGGGGADRLYGDGGNDHITGGTEDDLIAGQDGDDLIGGEDGSDRILGGAGFDRLYGDSGNDHITGGTENDFIAGQDGDDLIGGEEGDDRIEGGAGFDRLYGDAGNDFITGGTENDFIAGQDGDDLIGGEEGDDRIEGGAGADRLYGDGGNDHITGGTENDLILGQDGDDLIGGEGGDDRIEGGAGRDSLYGDGGNDLILGGTEDDILHGQDGDDAIGGEDGNDRIEGGAGRDSLYGDAGNDTIIGGAGLDSLYGQAGDDMLVVDDAFDLVFENLGEGRDTVVAAVSYTLAAGSEIEVFRADDAAGTGAIDLTGNEFANLIQGNAGNNSLDGGAGMDTLEGFGGDDTYTIDSAGDVVVEGSAAGNDTVATSVSYALTAGSAVEVLRTNDAAGTGAIDLTGNEFANLIQGNAGNNSLDGGAGADTLEGFGGDDTYTVDSAGDVVVEGSAGGNDTVVTSVNLTLGANLEALVGASGNASIFLTGNALANVIRGNAGQNLIDGREGSDRLEGGAGADGFHFTTALGAANVDTIVDFSAAEDHIGLGGAAGQPFAALASGALGSASFRLGSVATQASDRILYDQATGALYYDSDGLGGAAAVQFATLQPGLALTAANFVVQGPPNNAPTITSGMSATIAENSATSTIVYQAIAGDLDGDSITFSLSGADAALFTLDQNGALRLRSPADFETRSTYDVIIQAADSSGQGASRAVRVNVSDVIEGGGSTTIIAETTSINDTASTAQTINRSTFTVASNPNLPDQTLPSATIQGSISATGDKDFFTVTLQAGELLILDVDGVTGGLDALLRVFGPDGVEFVEADDAPLDPGSATHPASSSMTLDSFVRFRAPTSGTYTFSIESFQQGSAGTYNINVSVGPVATAAQIQEEDIQSLISGAQWNTSSLTYSFPTSAADYSDYPAPPVGEMNEPQDNFGALNFTQQSTVRQILAGFSNLTNLAFSELTTNRGGAQLRFGLTDDTEAAHAYLPHPSDPRAGDSWFRNSPPEGGTQPIFGNPILGGYAYLAMMHEVGHALGLKHGHESPALSPGHDSMEFSIMTYRSYVGDSLSDGGYRNETYGFAQSLMMYDIAALQRMYGADFTFNGGDSVYRWNASNGQMSVNGSGLATPGANRVFLTVWDGGGNDTYDLSNYANSVTIDLRPGEWTTTSSIQLANLGGGNYARGNVANALLFSGDARSLIENAIGGTGSDTLIANQTANRLTGGAGSDTFRWMSEGDSAPGAADTITDFLRGSDRIDLSAIDAVSGTATNDAFRWIGNSAFSGSAGELRQEFVNGSLHIFGDVNGDGVADLDIIVSNQPALGSTDFLF